MGPKSRCKQNFLSAHPSPRPPGQLSANLPTIAVVEDNSFILDAWKYGVTDAAILPFESVEQFEIFASTPDFAHVSCVVTDLHFANHARDGVALVRSLKERAYGPVILSSDASTGVHSGLFDLAISKDPRSWRELNALVTAARTRRDT